MHFYIRFIIYIKIFILLIMSTGSIFCAVQPLLNSAANIDDIGQTPKPIIKKKVGQFNQQDSDDESPKPVIQEKPLPKKRPQGLPLLSLFSPRPNKSSENNSPTAQMLFNFEANGFTVRLLGQNDFSQVIELDNITPKQRSIISTVEEVQSQITYQESIGNDILHNLWLNLSNKTIFAGAFYKKSGEMFCCLKIYGFETKEIQGLYDKCLNVETKYKNDTLVSNALEIKKALIKHWQHLSVLPTTADDSPKTPAFGRLVDIVSLENIPLLENCKQMYMLSGCSGSSVKFQYPKDDVIDSLPAHNWEKYTVGFISPQRRALEVDLHGYVETTPRARERISKLLKQPTLRQLCLSVDIELCGKKSELDKSLTRERSTLENYLNKYLSNSPKAEEKINAILAEQSLRKACLANFIFDTFEYNDPDDSKLKQAIVMDKFFFIYSLVRYPEMFERSFEALILDEFFFGQAVKSYPVIFENRFHKLRMAIFEVLDDLVPQQEELIPADTGCLTIFQRFFKKHQPIVPIDPNEYNFLLRTALETIRKIVWH